MDDASKVGYTILGLFCVSVFILTVLAGWLKALTTRPPKLRKE